MTPLFGQDRAVDALRTALDGGGLHHAWLLTGPEGVGKASFANRAALRILAEAAGPTPAASGLAVEDEHPIARLFVDGRHPDYRVVKREVWAGTKPNEYVVPESERSGTDQPVRSIRIKQIRMLARMLMTRPSLSRRRVIVVDSADDFENQAANAFLKMLEEPPEGTIFLLVSHAPERLLPTIRSRCRQVRFSLLDHKAMVAALRVALPDEDEREIETLASAAPGSPGRALAYLGLDIGKLDAAMRKLASDGDPTNARRSALAQSLAAKSAQPRYEAFLVRAPSLIADAARERRGAALAEALGLWERASQLARSAVRLSLDPQSTAFEIAGLLAALAPKQGHG